MLKLLKSIFHWVKVAIKIILLIVFMPLFLLYYWLKTRIYRFTLRHELRKYKLSRKQIKYLMSGVMKLSDGMGFIKI